MSTQASVASRVDTQFASEVRSGLMAPGQKWLPSSYLYDAIGSALFEAITLLPEYGLTRADARVIDRCAPELRVHLPGVRSVAELGSGSGKKTRRVLEQFGQVDYYPIDVSRAALDHCAKELAGIARIHPVEASYLAGLHRASVRRAVDGPMLILFLGSTIGNFGFDSAVDFLISVKRTLRRGDALLLGADLVKPEATLLAAYDDPTGVTAAFNLNLLGRLNRELGANFNLRMFRHEVRWNTTSRAIEMYLRAMEEQVVFIGAAGVTVTIRKGETIWTESSHKFDPASLQEMARASGFTPLAQWTDSDWPFAECLWKV